MRITEQEIFDILRKNDERRRIELELQLDADIDELNERIARAVMSYSPAFSGKEYPRDVAKLARAVMAVARSRDIAPAYVNLSLLTDSEELKEKFIKMICF